MNPKTNKQKVIKGLSTQTIVTIALGVVEIVSFSIMSRLLTKADFGYYAAINAVVIVFASFSETGIGSAIVQCKALTKRFVDNAFTMSLLFGTIISVVLFLFSDILADAVADQSMALPLKLMSITLLLHCLTSVFTSLMHRRLEFLRIGAINLTSLVVTTIVAIWLAYDGYGYYAIITKSVLQSLITFILAMYFCKTKFDLSLDRETSLTIFKYSAWLMASVVFRNLSQQIDKLMMPRLLSVNALGAYNRPKEFVTQISSKINGIFDTTLFPILSSIQDDKQKLEKSFLKSLYFLNIFSFVLCLEFCINSKLLIRIFLGEEWLSLETIFIIISLSIIFNIDGRLADCYLRSLALTKQQFYFRIIETVMKTGGTIVGSQWGIIGVVTAVTSIDIIMKLLKLMYVSVKLHVKIFVMLCEIISSWRFSFIIIPLCIVALYSLPESMLGDILLQCFYIIICLAIFLLFPNLVGKKYHKNFLVPLLQKIRKQ